MPNKVRATGLRILLIGGNGFIGRFVVDALQQQGHALAMFHRGSMAAHTGLVEIRGDRNQLKASGPELERFAPDATTRPPGYSVVERAADTLDVGVFSIGF